MKKLNDGFPTETLGNDKLGETFGNDSFSLCHPERSIVILSTILSSRAKRGILCSGKDSSSFGLGMTNERGLGMTNMVKPLGMTTLMSYPNAVIGYPVVKHSGMTENFGERR